MKISSKLPQFERETALIAVAGTQEADFYVASNGVLNKVFHYKLEKTKYSDREDFAARGSIVFESGAKFENKKLMDRKNFILGFCSQVKTLATEKDITTIYLLAPSTILLDLEAGLGVSLKKKVKAHYLGNFHKKPISGVLQKLKRKPLK